MKKWGLFLMLFAVLAGPALACGFPLPSGNTTMAVSKAVCADGEAVNSCQVRQDAYEMMAKLQSASVKNLKLYLYFDSGNQQTTEATVAGSFDYQVASSDNGLGASVHAIFDQGDLKTPTSTDTLTGYEFIVVGDQGYTSKDSGKTWTVETLDSNAKLGLQMILGLGGATAAQFDLFGDPSVFTVSEGQDTEIDGQKMVVQTLTLDLAKLMGNAKALGALMDAGFASMGTELGMSQQSLGVTPDQIAGMSAMLLPYFAGTEMTLTLYIGKDDGLIHRVEENYVFKADMTSAGSGSFAMTYQLSGDITQHNAPLAIKAPTNASEGSGLFGSGGLGSNLFGGK